ncbi:uncharacterized protein LY79DRAFT_533752 [Colletotrichum navitas]|uniref:Uncharacterized protein n=1 Tax=Colletotrichum navitas TaxID=681940 RepID=A0AAD8VAJ9_9PEZI|nr:uncharacterized protein LY79DRAFT_533752 [Colletotrichum navitas]KAK1600482.1 hypothetical protein LY79DRAFT_533752 [Colletotrichum navitas]
MLRGQHSTTRHLHKHLIATPRLAVQVTSTTILSRRRLFRPHTTPYSQQPLPHHRNLGRPSDITRPALSVSLVGVSVSLLDSQGSAPSVQVARCPPPSPPEYQLRPTHSDTSFETARDNLAPEHGLFSLTGVRSDARRYWTSWLLRRAVCFGKTWRILYCRCLNCFVSSRGSSKGRVCLLVRIATVSRYIKKH